MNKKYYYSDPLAAAWMAKHHGMKLLADDGEGSFVDAGARFIDCDDTFRELWQHDFSYLGKFWIHPDSLSLLEPQVGDVVATGRTHGEYLPVCRDNKGLLIDTEIGTISPDGLRIILRDNALFHWPEVE